MLAATPTGASQQVQSDKNVALSPKEIRDRYTELKSSVTRDDVAAAKEALEALAVKKNVQPKEMLDAVSKISAISFLLAQDCRIPESYTIAEHESSWLGTFERYGANGSLALPLKDSDIRILGVLHDIGKPLPDSKADQGVCTLQVLADFKEALPLDQKAFRIICSVIGNDPIGRFVVTNLERQATLDQRKALAEVAKTRLLTIADLQEFAALVKIKDPDDQIKQNAALIADELVLRAKGLGVEPIELFNMHLISYLSDVGAYTYDAISFNAKRSKPGIEFVFGLNPHFEVGVDNELFARDAKRGIMQLSPGAAALVDLIEENVRARG